MIVKYNSTNFHEQDVNLQTKIFEREFVSYDYDVFTNSSENRSYPIKEIFPPATTNQEEREKKLSAAARTLLPDYTQTGELTIFTSLDHEDFHE